MGREYIFAVTLAALAAVFLQGCGKVAPVEPAPASVTTTITAPATKGATVIQTASNAGFGIDSKITITDPTTKKSEVNGISGFGSIILMAPLQNDYGVSSTVTMLEADMGKATLASVTTSSTVIESLHPTVVLPNPNGTTFITLKGPEVAGDTLAFVSADELCNSSTATAMIPTTFGDANTSAVFVPSTLTVGSYIICYRQVGRTDLVQQTQVKLYVQAAAGATKVKAISPTEITANTAAATFTLTPTATTFPLAEYKGAFVAASQDCPLPSSISFWKDVTYNSTGDGTFQLTNSVGAAGSYKLCLKKGEYGSTASKQTDPTLTVNAASRLYALMEEDDSNNMKPVNSSSTNIVLGAGVAFMAMAVAFVAMAVKKATSHANEEQNLEESLE